MKPFLYLIFCVAVGVALSSRAREADSSAQTNGVVITSKFIAQLMREARTNNPGLLAADSRTQAAAANVQSVREWEDPMFLLGGSVFSERGMNPAQVGDLTYGITETLPLWGMPRLNRQMARAERSASEAEARYQFQQLRRDLTKALFTAALAERVVDIHQENLLWLKTTSQAVDAKYRAGQADAADSLEIQNEVAMTADQLRTDQLELKHDQFVLDRLLNRKGDAPWPPMQLPAVAAPVSCSTRLLALAFANEPELKVLEQKVRQAQASAALAHRSRLPNISVGVQGNEYSGDGGFRSGMFTLSFPLPWGNAGKYREDYRREKENEKAAERDREDQALTVREELDELTTDLDAARRQALLYQNEISVRARQELADRLAGWEAGRVTLREALDARREALDAQLMAARAIAGQYQTLADLVLWTGQETFESVLSLSDAPIVQSAEK